MTLGRRLVTVIILCVNLVGCAPINPYVRQHGNFAGHCSAIKQVAVLRPEIEIYTVYVGGSKQLFVEQTKKITDDLVALIDRELGKRGFQAFPAKLEETAGSKSENLFQDAEIRQLYQRVTAEFKENTATVKPADNQRLNYECNLGDDAKKLAVLAKGDALIFVRLSGYRRSGGSIAGELATKVALALVTGAMAYQNPTGVESLQMTMVDGKTGDVLWANQTISAKFGFSGPKFGKNDLTELVEALFKDFPKR